MVEYSFSPGLYDKIRVIDLEIYNDFKFKITIMWHKMPEKHIEFNEEYGRSLRRIGILEDILPDKIKSTLEELISFPKFELKRFYPELTEEQKKEYTPLDVGHEDYNFFIEGEKYYINVSPYIFKKEFLKIKQELLFLKFHEAVSEWIDEVHEKLIATE